MGVEKGVSDSVTWYTLWGDILREYKLKRSSITGLNLMSLL